VEFNSPPPLQLISVRILGKSPWTAGKLFSCQDKNPNAIGQLMV
jgi:hypothetical protein